MAKTLKLTSCIAVGGDIVRAGELVEVTDSEARDLLSRGKAVLATAADDAKPVARTLAQETELNPDLQAGDDGDADDTDAAPAGDTDTNTATSGRRRGRRGNRQ